MVDRDTWLEIFHTVMSNPLRTGLTGLSIALGIFILVVMQGLGTGLETGVNQTFGDDAVNFIRVETGNAQLAYRGRKPNRRVELHNGDVQAMKTEMDSVPALSRLVLKWGSTVRYRNEQGSYGVRGVDPDQREIGQVNLTAGRFVNERDVDQNRKSAVIGGQILADLYPRGATPAAAIGSFIQVRGIQFVVVGVFNQAGSRWENRSVYVPFSTAQKLFTKSDVVNRVAIGTGDATLAETRTATSSLMGWLRNLLVVHPDDTQGVWVVNRNEQAEIYQQIFGGIRLFLWFVGMMTLLAGAMGVANIMAIVVRERTKEIGVRKALGATSGSIVAQIVQEAVFLMLISGCIGLVTGTWLLQGIVPFVEHDFFSNPRVDFRSALAALCVLTLVGVASAIGPALRAVSIRPVEALRDE
tara:strand:+ start:591 stop:1829 length:1239 start_codon:yes stop_codon:yes gene_type:complete